MDYQKNYYQKNKQKYKDNYKKELKQIYYQQNRDKILETVKEYNMENKNRIRSYNIIYNQIHKRELDEKRSIIKCYGKLYYDLNCKKIV
jgi:hypothetical protein